MKLGIGEGILGSVLLLGGLLLGRGAAEAGAAAPPPALGALGAYSTPLELAYSPDGGTLAVTDPAGGCVRLIELGSGMSRAVALAGTPTGLCWAGAARLWVGEYGAGAVAEVDARGGAVLRRVPVGRYPSGLAAAGPRLLVANSATHTVSLLDASSGAELGRLPAVREPECIALTPDGATAVVSNLLPRGRADDIDYGAVLSLLDLAGDGARRDVRLPAGSSDVRGVAVHPSGRWAYAVHVVGRTRVPATQLERGWVSTNALSIVDLAAGELYATLLLDHPLEGAADPWGIALAADGAVAWITLSGVHQLARVDLARLHDHLAGGLPDGDPLARTEAYSKGVESIWLRIKRDPGQRAELVNDLAALHAADLIERLELGGARGPRGIALSPDGRQLAVAAHFSGEVLLVDTASGKVARRFAFGAAPADDPVARGRELFHDATLCFQNWLSCATCHPNEGRVDGMNWDTLADGIGNPKNLKSLLQAHETPPMMWRGAREDLEIATEKGFRFLLRQPQPGEVDAVLAYLRSLQPEPSPYLLAGGALSPAAARGRELFHGGETGCAACHKGPLYTDLKMHDVGTRGPVDHGADFDTPSLVELYRTAPFLHDGRSETLRELLTRDNPGDRHGISSELDEEQLEDLIAYLMSL